MEEEELNRLAREELLLDTKRAAVRAEMVGAHGWAKPPPSLKANKRFLNTMMLNTVGSSSSTKKQVETKDRNRKFSRQVTRLVCKSPPQRRKHKGDNYNSAENVKSKPASKKLPSDTRKSHSSKSSKPRKKKSSRTIS